MRTWYPGASTAYNCVMNSLSSNLQVVDARLQKLHEEFDNTLLSDGMLKILHTTSQLLNEKSVSIGVFGEVNCGKSTLLNAFLGDV